MSINTVERIDDQVPVRHVLISVSDKTGLETFIPDLRQACPGLRIFSTGGTHGKIQTILGDAAAGHLSQVSEYTGQPETQGGLVKTLDFKIYLGLLTETYNEAHQGDLARTAAVPIDMVVVNLYPFQQTIAQAGVSVEGARGQIDIGGPCMIRAAAKNFIRVAPVVDPADYPSIVDELQQNGGRTSLQMRFALAQKAFGHTADYDRAIAAYLGARTAAESADCYQFQDR
jgi:phosphoribosylaminoimidazolecarboxamide formyltransferase/IMP cyclohydrolase